MVTHVVVHIRSNVTPPPPLTHVVPKFFLASEISIMTTFNPGRESVVLFKYNVPYSAVYDTIIGLHMDYLCKFNINAGCLIRRQNQYIGKFEYVLQSPTMKWIFQARVALYDSFILCNPGGTIWTSTPRFQLYLFRALDA